MSCTHCWPYIGYTIQLIISMITCQEVISQYQGYTYIYTYRRLAMLLKTKSYSQSIIELHSPWLHVKLFIESTRVFPFLMCKHIAIHCISMIGSGTFSVFGSEMQYMTTMSQEFIHLHGTNPKVIQISVYNNSSLFKHWVWYFFRVWLRNAIYDNHEPRIHSFTRHKPKGDSNISLQ